MLVKGATGNHFGMENGVQSKNTSLIQCYVLMINRSTLQWRHNGRNCVSNHQPLDCLLNGLFRQIKENIKLRVTGLYVGNSPVTSELPAQMASNAEMFPFDDVIMITECVMAGWQRTLI